MRSVDDVTTTESSSPQTRRSWQRLVDWLFRNPKTGDLAIVQVPNLPLAIFLVGAAISRLAHPTGATGTAVSIVSDAALVWWAGDEVLRGSSRFRRMLGAVVLVGLVVSLLA